LAAAGFCFGTAILMKQHAAFIALWAGLVLLAACFRQQDRPAGRRWLVSSCSASRFSCIWPVLPVALACRVFGKFWFWTIDYAREYVSIIRLADLREQLLWS